jgi:hypothetical protein
MSVPDPRKRPGNVACESRRVKPKAITRNHTCQSLPELVDLALAWLTQKRTFRVQDSLYASQEKTEAA